MTFPMLPSKDAGSRRDRTVLLVDDNDAVRRVMQEYLEMCGYTVVAAEGGSQALTIAEQWGEKIDALVADVMMPKMTGVELAERLTTRLPQLRVVFVSGFLGDALARTVQSMSAARLLIKPFGFTELVDEIASLFGDGEVTP